MKQKELFPLTLDELIAEQLNQWMNEQYSSLLTEVTDAKGIKHNILDPKKCFGRS